MPRSLIREKDVRLYLPGNPTESRTLQDVSDWIVEAECLATDLAGDFVRVRADKVLDYYQVEKVDITDMATMPAVGLIEAKQSATLCTVQLQGLYVTTGLTYDQRYWIGADSRLSATHPPRNPGSVVGAQVIGVALSSTELLLRFDQQVFKLRA